MDLAAFTINMFERNHELAFSNRLFMLSSRSSDVLARQPNEFVIRISHDNIVICSRGKVI